MLLLIFGKLSLVEVCKDGELKLDSHLPKKKNVLFASVKALWEWWIMLCISWQKNLFVLKRFLPWVFSYVEKTTWLKK